jgi:hypothetical protein
MKIITNISKKDPKHDLILYPPIEKQVYDLLSQNLKVVHRRENALLVFCIEGTDCYLEVSSRKATITIITPSNGIRFGEGNYATFGLDYNKDITEDVKNIGKVILKLQDLEKRAKSIAEPDWEAIKIALEEQLATKELQIGFWEQNLFNDVEITFYIHPRESVPADGLIVCIDSNNKINPFWNSSTKRRTLNHRQPDKIEFAAGAIQQFDDVESIKAKIKIIEKLQEKLDAFDPNKSPVLVELIELKKQCNSLLYEFQNDIK